MNHAGNTYHAGKGFPGRLLLPLLFLFLSVSCSLDDWRDECCEGNTVRFRYRYRGADRFTEYIGSTRYFLFDGTGRYVKEMEPMECCPARVEIGALAVGSYTLVCIGNLDDYGTPVGYAEGGLEAFRLKVDDHFDKSGAFANGDRLYWGECPFTLVRGAANDFTGEMSNVHCLLRVRVEWERLPEYGEGYRYRLEGVATEMDLHGRRASVIDDHAFPAVEDFTGSVLEEVPMRRRALEASLYTLRWTDGEIPRFRLYHGSEPAAKEVDLGPIFRRWNWYPGRAPVQEYKIRLTIHTDGGIEVNPGLEAGVGDWEDGGSIG